MNLLKIQMAISYLWFRLLDLAGVFLGLSVTTHFAGSYFVRRQFLCRECTLRHTTGIKTPFDAVIAHDTHIYINARSVRQEQGRR